MKTIEKIELSICSLVLFYYLSHGVHDLQRHSSYISNLKKFPKNVTNNLSDGWKYISRRKDGDMEWDSFCSHGLQDVSIALFGYLVLSGFISTKVRRLSDYIEYDYFRLIIAFSVISYLFSFFFTLIACVIASVFYIQSKVFRSNIATLVLLSGILLTIAYFPDLLMTTVDRNNSRIFLLNSIKVLLSFRCCSYCFESNDFENENIIDYLSYIFYLPTFILGPVITYDKMKQTESLYHPDDSLITNISSACIRLGYIIVKLAILDYVLHYIYIFALTDHLNELSSASTILLMALVVIFDWLKCYFLFEILKIIMEFDGIEGPAYPKPLFAVTTFADTYFDRSLHFWVSRYFYDPNCNDGFIKESIGAFLAFFVVWLSQGASWEVGVWALLNFTGLQLESFISRISHRNFEFGAKRILKFFIIGMNYLFILKANFIGVVGYDKTVKFGKLLMPTDKLSGLSVMLVVYCYASINTIIANDGYSKYEQRKSTEKTE